MIFALILTIICGALFFIVGLLVGWKLAMRYAVLIMETVEAEERQGRREIHHENRSN